MATSIASLGLSRHATAQPVPAPPSRPILFANFRLFDGKSGSLREGVRLLVEGNRIKALVAGNPAAPDGSQVIDCGGRVLMPGLIDAHWHSLFAGLPLSTLLTADVGFDHLAAGAEAERTLMRGFTTVRDLGGPVFAFKQAIDQGLVSGPRIYPSGGMITSTGGHGDLRPLSDVPRVLAGRRALRRGPAARLLPITRMRSGCVCASSFFRARRRSNSREAAAYLHRAARWICPR